MVVSGLDRNLGGMIDFLNSASHSGVCPIESLFISF